MINLSIQTSHKSKIHKADIRIYIYIYIYIIIYQSICGYLPPFTMHWLIFAWKWPQWPRHLQIGTVAKDQALPCVLTGLSIGTTHRLIMMVPLCLFNSKLPPFGVPIHRNQSGEGVERSFPAVSPPRNFIHPFDHIKSRFLQGRQPQQKMQTYSECEWCYANS